MERTTRACQSWGYWLWSGLGLMSMALFIHPMSPDDFLGWIWSDPLQTLSEPYGIQAALMFWTSVALAGIGVAGGLACLIRGKRRTMYSLTQNRRQKTAPYALGYQQENIEEYWSFL